MPNEPSPVVCKNCALFLVRRCYGRHRWFRLVREPLVWGMRILGFFNGIDAGSHPVNNPECRACVRFLKAELEEKSPTFRFLNDLVGQRFSSFRNSLLTREELDEAKRLAAERMDGKGGPG